MHKYSDEERMAEAQARIVSARTNELEAAMITKRTTDIVIARASLLKEYAYYIDLHISAFKSREIDGQQT